MPQFTFGFSHDGRDFVHSVMFKAENFAAAMDAVKAIEGVEPVSLREEPEWPWVISLAFVLLIFMQSGLFMLVMARGVWNLSSRTADSTTSWIIIAMVAFFLFMSLGAPRMIRARNARKAQKSLAEMVAAVETPQPTFPTLERMGSWQRFMPIMMVLVFAGTYGPTAVATVLDATPEQLKGIQSVFMVTIISAAAMSVLGSDTPWRGVRKKA